MTSCIVASMAWSCARVEDTIAVPAFVRELPGMRTPDFAFSEILCSFAI